MPIPRGLFDPLLVPNGWFDDQYPPQGWFDSDQLDASSSGASYTLTADVQSVSISGIAAGTLAQRRAVADSRTYSITGIAAGTLSGRRVVADVRSYSLSGFAAGTLASRLFVAVFSERATSGRRIPAPQCYPSGSSTNYKSGASTESRWRSTLRDKE